MDILSKVNNQAPRKFLGVIPAEDELQDDHNINGQFQIFVLGTAQT